MEINKHILPINAELKYIEFLLHALTTSNDSKTVGEIKKDFLAKFKIELPHLLNQHFGIIRIIPLLLMREELKNEGKKYDRRISIVRHALAHNKFSINETGYEFYSNAGNCKMNYSEFVDFIWLIENEYYTRK
ncbi:MAG: hypothetical protein ABSG97_00400 [Sedimentisphaerales bacterium]